MNPPCHSPSGAYRHANRISLIEKKEKLCKRRNIPQRELFTTLRALNDTQPVNTLPRELFVYIMEHLHLSSDVLDTDRWLGRLYVCRRWYEIITSMPSFWRQIYVSSHPEWLELCLSRCAGMTADIYFTGRLSLRSTISTLQEHSQLVRAITYSVLRSSWASDISRLLALPLPSLEKVDVLLQTKSERLAVVDLPQESYARLRFLCLRSCNAPLDSAAYTSLRTLKLIRSKWSITFNTFINIIISAKQLEELVLDDCFSDLALCPNGFPQTHPPRCPPTTLSRLQALQLTTLRSSLGAQIIAHIRVPNATRVDIRTHANSSNPQPSVWGLLPPDPASFSPTFSNATSLSVGFPHPKLCQLHAQSASHSLFMQVYLKEYTQFSDAHHALDDFLKMFAHAPLRKLAVLEAEIVASATWEHVFRSLPTLQHLELSGRNFTGRFFAALQAASEHGDANTCCPDLSTISIVDHSYGHEGNPTLKATADKVLLALRTRAKRGIKLKQLKIVYPYHPWAYRESHTYSSFPLALRELVSDVRFEA